MQSYTIGEVSRRVGIKVPTLRYYEQAGLIPEPGRSEGGQRRYSEKLMTCRSGSTMSCTLPMWASSCMHHSCTQPSAGSPSGSCPS